MHLLCAAGCAQAHSSVDAGASRDVGSLDARVDATLHDAGRRDAGAPDAGPRDATLVHAGPDLAALDSGPPRCAPFDVRVALDGALTQGTTTLGPGASCSALGFVIISEEETVLEARYPALTCGPQHLWDAASCGFFWPPSADGLSVAQWNTVCDLEAELGPREWFCLYVRD